MQQSQANDILRFVGDDLKPKLRSIIVNSCTSKSTQSEINVSQLLVQPFADYYARWSSRNDDDWQQRAPIAFIDTLFDTTTGQPKPFESLSLRALIALINIDRKFRPTLTDRDCKWLNDFDEKYLLPLYAAVHLLPVDHTQQQILLFFRTLSANELAFSDDALSRLENGTYKSDEKSNAKDEHQSLVDELDNDILFQDKFLKYYKSVVTGKSENFAMNDWRLKNDEQLRKIELNASVDLDNIRNLRQTILRRLLSVITCVYCNDRMQNPRTLSCLHSGCLECILKTTNAQFGIKCPFCQKQTRLTIVSVDDAVRALPCSFVLAALIGLYTKLESNSTDECHRCIQPAKAFDFRTGELLCANHRMSIYHNTNSQPKRQHLSMIVDAIELINSSTTLDDIIQHYCPHHDYPLEQYCRQCQSVCCANATCVGQHSSHSTQLMSLNQACNEQRELVRVLGDKLSEKDAQAEIVLKLTEHNQLKTADLQENIRDSIRQYFNDLRRQLDAKETLYHEQLDKAADQCWQIDDQHRNRLIKFRNEISTTKDHINALIDAKKFNTGALSQLQSIETTIYDHLVDSVDGIVLSQGRSLKYPESGLQSLVYEIANLQCNMAYAENVRGWETAAKLDASLKQIAVYGTKLYTLERNRYSLTTQLHCFDMKKLSDAEPMLYYATSKQVLQAVAVSQNTILLASETQTHLELMTMRMKKSLAISRYTTPNSTPVDTIIIDYLDFVGSINVKFGSSILNSNSHLLVGDSRTVAELDAKTGALLRKFDFTDAVSIVDFAFADDHRRLFIIDGKSNQLFIYANIEQPTTSNSSSGKQFGVGILMRPTSVAVDVRVGCVFVADPGAEKVQIFDFDGKFLMAIAFPDEIATINKAPTTTMIGGSVRSIISGGNSIDLTPSTILCACGQYLYFADTRVDTVFRWKYGH